MYLLSICLLILAEGASAKWLNQTVVGESELDSPSVDKNVGTDE